MNIIHNENEKITSEQLIYALFGKTPEDLSKEIRDNKGKYSFLFKSKKGE